MVIREEYLVTINAKNRVQIARIQLDQNPFTKIYTIFRMTWQYGCKVIDQPLIQIEFGKGKRTPAEQAALRYNAILKNYLDKGYIKLSAFTPKMPEDIPEDEIKSLFNGNFVKDQNGIPKPMLAKLADECSSSIWDKEWICSRKLDGEPTISYAVVKPFKFGEFCDENTEPRIKRKFIQVQRLELWTERPIVPRKWGSIE